MNLKKHALNSLLNKSKLQSCVEKKNEKRKQPNQHTLSADSRNVLLLSESNKRKRRFKFELNPLPSKSLLGKKLNRSKHKIFQTDSEHPVPQLNVFSL